MWVQTLYTDNGNPYGPVEFDDETIDEDFPAFDGLPDINFVIGSPEDGYILLVRNEMLVTLVKER